MQKEEAGWISSNRWKEMVPLSSRFETVAAMEKLRESEITFIWVLCLDYCGWAKLPQRFVAVRGDLLRRAIFDVICSNDAKKVGDGDTYMYAIPKPCWNAPQLPLKHANKYNNSNRAL
jgi:hypothetical protein